MALLQMGPVASGKDHLSKSLGSSFVMGNEVGWEVPGGRGGWD